MSRSRHRTHKIESLEAMILMSGSTIDGMADSDVDPQTGLLMGPVENPELFATGGSSGVTGSGTGFEFSGTGEGGIAVGGDGMFPGGSIGGSPEGGVGGVSPAGGIGIGVLGGSDEGVGPMSEFDSEPGTYLRIPGDSETEYFEVRPSSAVQGAYQTEFLASTTADESLPDVFIQEVRIVGDEIWVLSVVAETPYSASSEAAGFAIGSARVPVPEELHTNGYSVREFRIGGAPDGSVSEAVAEVDSVANFLQLVGDSETEVLYDRDIDGVGFPQPGESGFYFGSQFGSVGGDDDRSYAVLPTEDGADFEWQSVHPGVGPLGVDLRTPPLGTGVSPETLVVTPRPVTLDSEIQTTAFATRAQLTDSLDELRIEDIRVVGDEVWLLTEAEEGTSDLMIRSGATNHRVEVEIPQELHEQGYNVREYRTGGSLGNELREGVQEVDTKADYLSMAYAQTVDVLYDHSDVEQSILPQGFAFTDNGEFALTEVDGDSEWTLVNTRSSPVSDGFVGGGPDGTGQATPGFDPSIEEADRPTFGILEGVGPIKDDTIRTGTFTGTRPGDRGESFIARPQHFQFDETNGQPTGFFVSSQVDEFAELHFREIRVVGDEIWALTELERVELPDGANSSDALAGSTSDAATVNIPVALHETGYRVREFRIGGSINGGRVETTQVESIDEYQQLAGSDSTILFDDLLSSESFQNGFAEDGESAYSIIRSDGNDAIWERIGSAEEFSTGSVAGGGVGDTVGGGITTDGGISGEEFNPTAAENPTGEPLDTAESMQSDSADGTETETIDNLGSVGDTTATNTSSDLPAESLAGDSSDSLAAASGAGSGNGLQTINGTDGDDWVSVENGSASVTAGAGDDSLHSSLNNSVLNGGDGVDTFYVYEGTSADFTIQQTDVGVVVSGLGVNGGTVENTLVNVERIVFNDREIDLTNLPDTVTESTPSSQVPSVPGFFGGSPNNDAIDGTTGDDEFYASAGSDQIDGGDGFDTLFVYGGSYLNPLGASTSGTTPDGAFSVNRISANTVVVEGVSSDNSGLRYELTDVERIIFDNAPVFLDGPAIQNDSGLKTLIGNNEDEYLATDECTDLVHAGGGDDTILLSNPGARRIDGGDGTDTFVIYEDSTEFRLVDLRDSFGAWWVFSSNLSVDLVDIEFIQFNDRGIATADILPPSPGEGFGRAAVILPPICFHV